MSHDIFLSYASADAESAARMAHVLEQQGLSVWWDRNIPPGRTWDQVLGEKLKTARCVVVLWTENSIGSDWVKDEAARGRQRGVLIPALLEDVEIPLGFGLVEAADLRGWNDDTANPEFVNFVSAIRTLIGTGGPAHTRTTGAREPATQGSATRVWRLSSMQWGAALLVVVGLVAYILARGFNEGGGILNVELWRVEGDRKAQLVASHPFEKPDQLDKVREWLVQRLASVAQTEAGPISVELQIPASLADADVHVKTTPPTELETYVYVVSGQNKARVKSPLTRDRLVLLEEDFFIEFRHTGHQSHTVRVVRGRELQKTFTLAPKQVSVAVEHFAGAQDGIGQKLSRLLVQDDRFKITTPDALENLREEIRSARAAIGVNRAVQTAIRDSLGVDFIVAGALEK